MERVKAENARLRSDVEQLAGIDQRCFEYHREKVAAERERDALADVLRGVLTYSGARGVYHALHYVDAVEKAEAILSRLSGDAAAGDVGSQG